jgi:lysophospholipase L1-like esterase
VFLDAEGIAQLNQIDYTHLTRKGHAQLADRLAQIVPGLV